MEEKNDTEGLIPAFPDTFKKGAGLEGIDTIVSLTEGTCTHRAAKQYCDVQQKLGRHLHMRTARTFDEAILVVHTNMHAMMLVPELHAAQKRLHHKSHYPEITSQRFQLANPPLHVATPIKEDPSDRTYLWALPTLLPLVKQVYGDELPFEEIIPMRNTQEAASYCSDVYGGAYCVTNEHGMQSNYLRPVKRLPHILMNWFLYRKQSQ